ncbi:MAG TPA: NAD-dependent epimerase/dehydratase family protein [Gemmatimonadales bacterium]|nr:NAD-dependent epimerase/dehydratase family protein [Gemmatimonadales bacterium]
MKRRVLVTGGAGFIGSHVADAFLAAGCEVTVVDNLSRGRRQNVPKGAAFLERDLGSAEARAAVADGKFEVIAHLAAQVDVRVSVADPMRDARENLMALLNLLEGARAAGTRRVVFSSSGGVVYGERTPPHVETAPKLPVSPYGVSKLAAEYYLACYATLFGLEAVALRYANVYGPRQDPHGEAGVVAIFGNRLRARSPLTVYGDGRQTRDYVYVGDVARANVLAAEAPLPPADGTVDARAFNVGTGVETSVQELAEAMIAVAGADVKVERAPARAGELQASALTAAKAGRLLGWTPQVALREGLKRTYDWIRGEAP